MEGESIELKLIKIELT